MPWILHRKGRKSNENNNVKSLADLKLFVTLSAAIFMPSAMRASGEKESLLSMTRRKKKEREREFQEPK